MANYNRAQLEEIAKQGGFKDYAAFVWSFIALAESEGDPTSVNKNKDGTTDVGLWQINSIHWKSHGWTEAWLKDPINNARAAYALAKDAAGGKKGDDAIEAGSTPWNASKESHGDYKGWQERMRDWSSGNLKGGIFGEGNTGEQEVRIPIVSDIADAAQTTTDAAVGAIKFAGKTAVWVGNPRNWLRVGYVVGGLALVIAGAAVMGKPAIEAASNVTPIGALTKGVKGAAKSANAS